MLIGRQIRFRNDVKARERYMNVLNPDIDIDSRWTAQEDADLLKYHNELGDKWAEISRKLGTNRTDCYCRQRLKQLKRKQETLRSRGAAAISKALQKSIRKPRPKVKAKPKPKSKAKPKRKPGPKPKSTSLEGRKRKRNDSDLTAPR